MRILIVIFLLFSFEAFAESYFVVSGSYEQQDEAQREAVLNGGWVLNTNFYSKLKPNFFAVVRGPFKSKRVASKVLLELQKTNRFKNSYIKDAGTVALIEGIDKSGIPLEIVLAILGEIRIDYQKVDRGRNPCEPSGEFIDYSLHYYSLKRVWEQSKNLSRFESAQYRVDIGGLWLIGQDQSIERMRKCFE